MKNKASITVILRTLIILTWIYVFGLVAGTYLPFNPYTPSALTQLNTKAFLPQGWAFFTKSPLDENAFIYSTNQERIIVPLLRMPNSSLSNWWGLKRTARAQGSEYGLLLDKLGPDSSNWRHCESLSHLDCLKSSSEDQKIITIVNEVQSPTLCGEMWIVLQKPIPWEWSKFDVHMPIMYTRLNVICDEQAR